VERLTKADRACAIAAAAAHDLNDELTVILTSVTRSIQTIEPGHPARPLLLDLRSAAQRCAWMASSLLNFSARRGVRPSAAKAERLVEIDTLT
jgi:signal transduction histidine kinase